MKLVSFSFFFLFLILPLLITISLKNSFPSMFMLPKESAFIFIIAPCINIELSSNKFNSFSILSLIPTNFVFINRSKITTTKKGFLSTQPGFHKNCERFFTKERCFFLYRSPLMDTITPARQKLHVSNEYHRILEYSKALICRRYQL